jgi:hypothetical protein
VKTAMRGTDDERDAGGGSGESQPALRIEALAASMTGMVPIMSAA